MHKNEFVKARLNIHYTHNQLKQHLEKELKPLDLPLNQFSVLNILKEAYPNCSSVNCIKEKMIDKNSDVSRLVDRLLNKKLVIRKECKTDRRQKEIQISQLGIKLIEKIGCQEKLLSTKINHLSLEEVTQLNQLLEKIKE
ncbi:MarR family winged helix-turn-helix transcriptional regulator [Lutibacter aestuarii]|uniref:MarR family winged helix-turn-helix transcriptional regulator n=1 Tax=Lutibacter aestuarii TaxID=861111 RepID=A0ABW2Z850_9FLAO|nr:MarR family transcriptional regulator [uncultured Lutibacter sp.]